MADVGVIRVAVGAWVATLVAAVVTLLTAAVLPRWVKVHVDTDGLVEEIDIGLWQVCRQYNESIYNCSTLDLFSSSTTTGWFHSVQLLSFTCCVTSVSCAISLCVLVVRYDCWRIRPHTIFHVVLSALLLTAGLLQLIGVILCGVNTPHSLPICLNTCPPTSQPMTSCFSAVVPFATTCDSSTASSYVIAAVGAGLALTSGLVGAVMARQPNGDDDDDDDSLLNGVAGLVTSHPVDADITG